MYHVTKVNGILMSECYFCFLQYVLTFLTTYLDIDKLKEGKRRQFTIMYPLNEDILQYPIGGKRQL